jgi:hypothetical protein
MLGHLRIQDPAVPLQTSCWGAGIVSYAATQFVGFRCLPGLLVLHITHLVRLDVCTCHPASKAALQPMPTIDPFSRSTIASFSQR